MNIHATKGDKVKFIGASKEQVNWGEGDDPNTVLTEGEVYTVNVTHIHSFHTKVSLDGYDGLYPSVAFEDEVIDNSENVIMAVLNQDCPVHGSIEE